MNFTKDQIKELIEPIKIARIEHIEKHPDADRLQIVKIFAGSRGETPDGTIQIVTGANNVNVGDFVPYLGTGWQVPGFLFTKGETFTLEAKPLRGIMSEGMILAEDEIGLSEDHEGIVLISNTQFPNFKGEEMIGSSIVDILTDDHINQIYKRAGGIEINPAIAEKANLVTKDLQEVVGQDDLVKIISERPLKVYWGTAPTGKPHLGYFVSMMKIADFLKAGSEVTILFANIHAFLDNMKSSWELLEHRTQYYEFIIKEILQSAGASIENLKFIKGTDYQLNPKYTMDMYKIATLTTVQSVKGAGAEVVKQVESPVLGGMLYPILQALDEEYLNVDAQLGGVDQRKIFMFAREYLPKIGYKKRIHFMTPLIPGLGKSGKMSSSEPNSKIDLDDSDEVIKEKISKAYSEDKKIEGNGLLFLLKLVIFRMIEQENRTFDILRDEKWGGNVSYTSYEEVEKDFVNGKLSSVDLKPAVAKEVIKIITPIREKIDSNIDLVNKAYPV